MAQSEITVPVPAPRKTFSELDELEPGQSITFPMATYSSLSAATGYRWLVRAMRRHRIGVFIAAGCSPLQSSKGTYPTVTSMRATPINPSSTLTTLKTLMS